MLHMQIRIQTCVYINTYVHVVCIHVYVIHICIHLHIICIFMYTHILTYEYYTFINIHMYMYVHIHICTYLCIRSTVVHMNKCESVWYKNTRHGRDANNCRDVTSDSWLKLSTNFPSMGFQCNLRISLFYSTRSRLCHYIVQWIHSFRQLYCQLLGLVRFVLTMVMSFRHGHGALVQKIGYSRIIYSIQRIWSWYFEKARWNHVCGKGRMDLTSKR